MWPVHIKEHTLTNTIETQELPKKTDESAISQNIPSKMPTSGMLF